MKKHISLWTTPFLILALMSFSACGFKKVATKTTAQVFYDASPTIDQEADVELAQQSLLGFLKILEGFYVQNPKDPVVLLLLARSYAGYAYGFTENDILQYKDSDPEKYAKAETRAKRFYERAKRYGLELLSLSPSLAKGLESSPDDFAAALQKQNKADVENLFWAGFAWGNYLNFHKDSVEAIASAPKIEMLMQRVIELDPDYYYGGAYTFMGAYYASRPKLLGGDPQRAQQNFAKAKAVTQGKNLMAPVAEAQFYAVQIQDRSLYKSLLQGVLNADAATLPEIRLMNELAKIRAQTLLEKESVFFN